MTMRSRNRITVRQRDASDCGPACIVSVLSSHGIRVPVARIRQYAGTDSKGTSMWGLVTALEKMGFEARGVRGSGECLDKLPLPFIAHLQNGNGFQHYVCVYRVKTRRIKVMDPGGGKLASWERSDFIAQWSGAAVLMVPRSSGMETGMSGSALTRLTCLVRPVGRTLVQAFIAAAIYTLLGLSTSVYIGKLTDHVFVTRNSGLLNLMSIAMVLITLLMVYLQVIRQVIVLRTGQVIDNQLITSYYRHLFRLPQRFFDSMRTGEIISRINDAIKIRGFINDAVTSLVVNCLVVIFSFLLMFLINRDLGLLMLGMIPFYVVIYVFYNHRNRHIEREVMEKAASFESQLVDSLQAATHIRQHNLTEFARERTENRLNRLLDSIYRSGLYTIRASGSMEFVNRIFTVALLWIGSGLVIRGQVTPGELLSFFALIGYFTGPV
ncbi:MAG: peptidase C39, partial [Bacteroidetes bacterium]